MNPQEHSLFPFELYEEILCRVPTKSLIRFKLTCKRWLALLEDKRFIYKHLTLLQEQIIRTNDTNMVKLINPLIGTFTSSSLPDELRGRSQIYAMIHCDGLFLCTLESTAIAVWNPCLNQVRWIQPKISNMVNYFYGIGYNGSTCDGYKIMRFMNLAYTKRKLHAYTGAYRSSVDIFEFNSNSWKTLNVSLDWNVYWIACRGLSLKGNMYWIAMWDSNKKTFIQSFNFSNETFEPLCSLPFEYGQDDVVGLSTFKGTNLSLMHQSKETGNIKFWVTNEVGNGVVISWTKFFDVATRPDIPILRADKILATPMHFIDKKNRIVVCCEEILEDECNVGVNMYVIEEDGVFKKKAEIEIHRNGFSWPFVSGYAYLPTLVPVPT